MFEYFHERRSAAVFYTAIMAIVGALLLVAYLHMQAENNEIPQDWPIILPGIAFVPLVFLCRRVRQEGRMRRLGRYKSTPLAQDEWVKARRKLAAKPTVKK
jgi:hypothetical protein